jgi:hypothetical protein
MTKQLRERIPRPMGMLVLLAALGLGPAAGQAVAAKRPPSQAARPGKYRLICAVPGHDAAGMWDTLIVRRGARAATAVS